MSVARPDFIPAAAAPVFAALGDRNRLLLLSRLGDARPRSIAELADGLPMTRQGATKHLRILERAGMVSSDRRGRENRYVIDPLGIAAAKSYLERASRQWDGAVARLRALVEGG